MNNDSRWGRTGAWTTVAFLTVVGFAACGGGGDQQTADTGTGSAAAPAPAPMVDSAQGGGAQGNPAQVALGDSIFHGTAGGGICFTCHGPDAKGVQGLGPNLTDTQWLHGDGSLQFIQNTVRTGVATPKEAAAPMPPMGGATLTPDQVNAVAAYVYSLSHK
jgi:cbb3-type cytochrome c oxidase subunit III